MKTFDDYFKEAQGQEQFYRTIFILNFSRALEDILKSRNVTINNLAKRLGYSTRVLKNVLNENKDLELSLNLIYRICVELKVSMDIKFVNINGK